MNNNKDHLFTNILKGIRHRAEKIVSKRRNAAGLSWYKTKQLKHLPYNSPHTYELLGKTIHFNNGPELLHSLHEIFIDEIYNIEFDSSEPYIIDCGANIGLSVIYLKSRYPNARLIAFEPDSKNFTLLQKNISSFSWKNTDLRNEAIWKEDSLIEFVSDGTLGSKLTTEETVNNVIKVKATRLKNLLIDKVDFLKMDIEGAEYEVLKDCGNHLSVVSYLFIEFHGFFDKMHQLTEILQLVQDNGFSYYIKEASNVYPTPFSRKNAKRPYDIQQNIFCFRK